MAIPLVGVDWNFVIQAILFALFAVVTALVAAVIGPTYDNLFVPEMGAGSLYPALVGSGVGPGDYLARAAQFSAFVLANVVDPAIALVALVVAVLYLSKAIVARWSAAIDGLLPRLVIAVIASNFTVPIAGAILGLAGSVYPVFAGWDGGAWRSWANLAGWGEIGFSWDNGALAFVLSLVEFAAVFLLVLAIGLRDALLAVLIVLLPLFTLLWPIPPLAPLARRAWFLFVELAFLPCVLVVPLELAVGSSNPVLLIAYLGVAVASPYLLSVAGTQLVAFGFPSAGGAIGGGVDRGLGTAPRAAAGYASPATGALRASGPVGGAAAGAARVAGSATAPAAAPLAVVELVGHGATHLVRHIASRASGGGSPSLPPIRPGGSG
ncbi:MAG TPA: hypothetical protein VMG81_07210 [Thermoplasmata archaeon]|nr:hypothetical protein [Thermoplasmata archaeon]